MAKTRAQVPTEKPATALTISKADLTAELLRRLDIGRELQSRTITTVDGVVQLGKDYNKWNNYNSEFLKQSFNNEDNEYKKSYDHINDWVESGGHWASFGKYIEPAPSKQIEVLQTKLNNKISNLEDLEQKVDLLKSSVELPKPIEVKTVGTENKNDVFIVHGHNNEIKLEVARTLEKLGLNPIILHEKPNTGRTLIEKFEAHSDVGFAIVILTNDDDGKAKTEVELHDRARQNVVLELGFFIGKLNRSRVLPLYSDGVELPSDINGLVYTPLDKAGTWKFAIVQELSAAGYSVDANALLK